MKTRAMNRKAAWVALEGEFRSLLAAGADKGKELMKEWIDLCCRMGIDLIFPCSRCHDNRVIYDSRIENNIYDWDALSFLCDIAGAHGIEIHPWFCYWGDGADTHPELHVKIRDGISQNEHWFCPARPESQQYFLNLTIEVLERYPVEGIHLDYIRYQDKPCYCDYHRADFKGQLGADPLELSADSPLWQAWNEYNVQTMTSFVWKISAESRKRGKLVSAAVFMPVDHHDDAHENPFRLDRIGVWDGHCAGCELKDSARCATCSRDYGIFQRWADWCRLGYLDYVCPMNYTPKPDFHKRMLERELKFRSKVPLFSGLALFPEATLAATREEIRYSLSQDCGVCFFDLIRLSQKSEQEKQEICAALKGEE